MEHHVVVRVIAKLVIAPILLFALYVQFHGDFGPGGGFQAGVIFAAGIILYSLIYGLDKGKRLAPDWLLRTLSGCGVLLYAGTGIASMLAGGNFLQYGALAHDPVHGQHLGIMLIEFGVGTTVASVMLIIFFHFSGRKRQ